MVEKLKNGEGMGAENIVRGGISVPFSEKKIPKEILHAYFEKQRHRA